MSLTKAIKQVFYISIISLLTVFFIAIRISYAQEITAIDFEGKPLGKIIPDGKVVGFDNALLGVVTADSLIINNAGTIIGGVVPQGVAIGNDSRFLGKVGSDGSVRSPSGQVVGRSLPNGLVVNEYFDIVGQIVFPGLVYNDDGKIAGRVTGAGNYSNLDGQTIGIVTPDGYAYKKIGDDYILDGKLISSKMVVSLQGSFIGSVVPGGSVTDFNSNQIGHVRANGFVYNENSKVIGKTVSSGYAFNNSGLYIGFISYNGNVLYNNQTIGKLRADGRISNLQGEIIGHNQSFSATATDLDGKYLGRLQPDGKIIQSDTVVGLVSAKGQVTNAGGNIIGNIITTGPVFDYKGSLRGHAISNGSVISLNGSVIGYVVGDNAFNLSGIMIGSVLKPKAVFNKGNFLGISGINSELKKQNMTISPFGYVFKQSGEIEGVVMGLDTFYNPFGTVSSYLSFDGTAVNNLDENIGTVIGQGYVLNPQKHLIAQSISSKVAVSPVGDSIGLPNSDNLLLNKSLKPLAKILPDTSVAKIKSGNLNYMPKLGESYPFSVALDFKGNLLGYLNAKGEIKNTSGAKIGKAVANSFVSDNSGIIIGFLSQFGSAIDDKCSSLGVTSPDGNISNYRGVYVGKRLQNDMVVSESGSILGYMVPLTPVIDFNGKIIGYPDYSGRVVNELGDFIGCLDSKHKLYNADNALIAQSISYDSVIGFDGKILGYSSINGLLIDKNEELIGYQQPNDNVNSSSGVPIGSLFKYTIAFDLENHFLGYVSKEGIVIKDKEEIGQVDFDGFVISKRQQIGYALYDFYVYDNSGKVIGIINRNGDVSNFTNQSLGSLDRGFVLKNGEVVARGNRDFNIRDDSHLVIGELKLNKDVVDNIGNIIGKLEKMGKITNPNGEKIAQATPLQYYSISGPQKKRQMLFDKDGNFIGYLDDDGNVVDANGRIIGKIDENGNILDADGNIIGKKGQNVKVYDTNGKEIGVLDDEGNVVSADDKIVAKINAKGQALDANGNIIGGLGSKWFDKSTIITSSSEVPVVKEEPDVSPALKLLEDSKYYKSLGIALTPDGEYLGEILEDDTVVDKSGNVVGYKMPDGLIIDDDGNLIGTEEIDNYEERESTEPFVPAGSFGPGGAYGVGNGTPGNLGPGGGFGPGERYDPARKAAMDAAMQNRRQNITVGRISSGVRKEAFDGYQKDWSEQGIPKSVSSWRVDMSEMIFSDKPIPAVISRAIDTNNPAPVTAYVERNVYAEEGRNIIIPSGSRLIGSFGSITAAAEATSESARVQISWERLIRPDGSIFVFSGQTADAQGRAGALGYVDQQLFKKYTLPVVTTVLTSAASYFVASADDAAGDAESSKQQAANDARQNFLSDMESLFDDILSDKTDVKAMTYIPAGTRIIVYPNTDLWLRTVERDEEESAKYQKPEILIDDVKTEKDNKEKNSEYVAKAASAGNVVYDPDEIEAEAVNTNQPLINDVSLSKKKKAITPPPPPPSSGTIPADTSSASKSSSSDEYTEDTGVPALF